VSGIGMSPIDPDFDLAMVGKPGERPVGDAATDQARGFFSERTRFHRGYQPYVAPPARGPMLSRAETYTALCLVLVVRCAWLDRFAPRCGWELTSALGTTRCKLLEGHFGGCQHEEPN
jgi:hypothetical protein